jgi:hypothetical protein
MSPLLFYATFLSDGYNASSTLELKRIRQENATMAKLVLDKVPAELLSQVEHLAAREQLPVAEKTVRLLQEAVGQRVQGSGLPVQEILERLIRNRFRSDPAGPDVVEMLRGTASDDRLACLRG